MLNMLVRVSAREFSRINAIKVVILKQYTGEKFNCDLFIAFYP